MWKKPLRGIVTLSFDDAYLDTYKHAIKYLDKVGIRSTVAIPYSFIGNKFEKRRVVSKKEIRDMVKYGHEIASHTITHPNLRRFEREEREQAIVEMAASKKMLTSLVSREVRSFVFPYIKKNQTAYLRKQASRFYGSARITLDRPCFNGMPPKDPYILRGFSVMRKHSLSYLNKQVDIALKCGLWLIEVFHLVGRKNTLSAHRPKPYRFFMHIDDFKKHVDYILSKDISILTQYEALRKLSRTP